MRRLLTIIIALLFSTNLCGAKSVGVVMNGGGAKGLYHIGVLKALEKRGIPIDYVAGTSIGAIVSGLYAAGYSPEEIEELAVSGQIEEWLKGRIDSSYGSYFRLGSTLRHNAPMLSARVNTSQKGGGINNLDLARVPQSLISTTKIDMALCDLFTPASTAANDDFTQLMIPFLCVASDITNDQKVVMTSGDLGRSIRASMAIPIAFSPIIDNDGNILYDGGIQDNFPWQSMQELFNPDLMIGSICGIDEWAVSQDLSLIDQIFLISMNKSNYELPEGNITILRDIQTGILNFNNAPEIIQQGYDDTMAQMDGIIESVGDDALKSSHYYSDRRRAFKNRVPKLLFNSYSITGLSDEQHDYAMRYMSISQDLNMSDEDKQRRMSYEELQTNLYTILSTGDFTTNYPNLTYNPLTSTYDFSIDMEYKSDLEVTFGGNLSSTPFNQIYVGATHTTIDRIAKTLFGELYLGSIYTTGRIGYRADFYHKRPMFVDIYYNISTKSLNHGNFGNLTPIDNTLSVNTNDNFLSVGIGRPLRQYSRILLRTNAGIESFKYTPNDTPIGQYSDLYGDFVSTRLSYLAAKLEVERSTIDNIYYPTQGSLLTLSLIGVTSNERSTTEIEVGDDIDSYKFYESHQWIGAKFNYLKYFTSNRVSLGLRVDCVYTTIPDMISITGRQLIMPNYEPTVHSQMVYMPEYSASKYAALGIMPSVRLWRELSLKCGLYAMARPEFNDTTSAERDSGITLQYTSEVALSYKTSVSALTLSLSKYNVENWNNLYLTFNYGFMIFSPRGTMY